MGKSRGFPGLSFSGLVVVKGLALGADGRPGIVSPVCPCVSAPTPPEFHFPAIFPHYIYLLSKNVKYPLRGFIIEIIILYMRGKVKLGSLYDWQQGHQRHGGGRLTRLRRSKCLVLG
jgi:hypothetical protein